MSLGGNMRAARKIAGDTQADTAAKLGMSASTYSNYERGDREPGSSFLVMFADAYDVTVDYLLDITPRTNVGSFLKMSADEMELLRDYRLLNNQGKEFIRQTMVAALNTYKKANFAPNMEAAKSLV